MEEGLQCNSWGCQTFSKMPYQHVSGVSPKLLSRGFGMQTWDVDGPKYIDYMMSSLDQIFLVMQMKR